MRKRRTSRGSASSKAPVPSRFQVVYDPAAGRYVFVDTWVDAERIIGHISIRDDAVDATRPTENG